MIGTSLPHKVQLSPNFGERKSEQGITTLILHYTGMSDAVKACDWLCNEESEVSCHYLIDEQGGIVQMVDEAARAWHAGVSSWHEDDDINSPAFLLLCIESYQYFSPRLAVMVKAIVA